MHHPRQAGVGGYTGARCARVRRGRGPSAVRQSQAATVHGCGSRVAHAMGIRSKTMRFKDREEVARLLAGRLAAYRGQHPLVLGVPRGAVPMARIIANELDGDLDVVLVRKLRAPGQPELAIGAVDEAGNVLKGEYFEVASDQYV